MPHFNKKNGFAYFDAEQTNERWSWAAKTPDGSRVVITLWQHEIRGKGSDTYLDTRELIEDESEWRSLPGNSDRIKLLKHAMDELDGIVFVLMTVAKKPKADPPWEIDYCFPWVTSTGLCHRMKVTFLDEKSGDFRVEYLDAVSL